MADIDFGEWMPDFPDAKNPGCTVADNVIPVPGGYAPQPGLVATAQQRNGVCLGARLVFRADGTAMIVGGTNGSLFIVSGSTPIVSTTGLNALNTGEFWDFCQFNDFVIATSINNRPRYLSDIDTDTTWDQLGGTPPFARYCERVEDFVMLGGIATRPNRIQWSSFNSPAGSWTPHRLTQAGYAEMPRAFGAVQRIIGGRYPMVMQERGISRLEYIGPPVIWRATEIEGARGLVAPYSAVTVGFVTYYLAQDGFWVTDGNSAQPIGSQRINRWFLENCPAEMLRYTHGALDFENESVVWAFRSEGRAYYDRMIRYSWSENRWSTATIELSRLVETVVGGMTLEEIGAAFATLEDVPGSFDDRRWAGRARALGVFIDRADGITAYSTFSGASLAARIDTAEISPVPGRRSLISKAQVLGTGGQAWDVAAIQIDNDRTEEQLAYRSPGVGGWAPQRSEGMAHRLSGRALPGRAWSKVHGMRVAARPTGGR